MTIKKMQILFDFRMAYLTQKCSVDFTEEELIVFASLLHIILFHFISDVRSPVLACTVWSAWRSALGATAPLHRIDHSSFGGDRKLPLDTSLGFSN